MNGQENLIKKLTLEFSVKVVRYCENLENNKRFVIARQLCRAGTSIGANVCEAQHGESKADFLHKIKIAMKEAEETAYWLEICKLSGYPDCSELQNDITSICNVLSKIIMTSKSNFFKKK